MPPPSLVTKETVLPGGSSVIAETGAPPGSGSADFTSSSVFIIPATFLGLLILAFVGFQLHLHRKKWKAALKLVGGDGGSKFAAAVPATAAGKSGLSAGHATVHYRSNSHSYSHSGTPNYGSTDLESGLSVIQESRETDSLLSFPTQQEADGDGDGDTDEDTFTSSQATAGRSKMGSGTRAGRAAGTGTGTGTEGAGELFLSSQGGLYPTARSAAIASYVGMDVGPTPTSTANSSSGSAGSGSGSGRGRGETSMHTPTRGLADDTQHAALGKAPQGTSVALLPSLAQAQAQVQAQLPAHRSSPITPVTAAMGAARDTAGDDESRFAEFKHLQTLNPLRDRERDSTSTPTTAAVASASSTAAASPAALNGVLSKFAHVLLEGIVVSLHTTKGKKAVMFSLVSGELRWQAAKGAVKRYKLNLQDITSIEAGKRTPNFQRVGSDAPDHCCLSILTSKTTLDLETVSAVDRDCLVLGFRNAIESSSKR